VWDASRRKGDVRLDFKGVLEAEFERFRARTGAGCLARHLHPLEGLGWELRVRWRQGEDEWERWAREMRALVGDCGDGANQYQIGRNDNGEGGTHDPTNSFTVLSWYAACPAATSGPYDGSK